MKLAIRRGLALAAAAGYATLAGSKLAEFIRMAPARPTAAAADTPQDDDDDLTALAREVGVMAEVCPFGATDRAGARCGLPEGHDQLGDNPHPSLVEAGADS